MDYSQIRGYTIPKLTLGTVALGMDYGISNTDGKPVDEKSLEIFSRLSINITDLNHNA